MCKSNISLLLKILYHFEDRDSLNLLETRLKPTRRHRSKIYECNYKRWPKPPFPIVVTGLLVDSCGAPAFLV